MGSTCQSLAAPCTPVTLGLWGLLSCTAQGPGEPLLSHPQINSLVPCGEGSTWNTCARGTNTSSLILLFTSLATTLHWYSTNKSKGRSFSCELWPTEDVGCVSVRLVRAGCRCPVSMRSAHAPAQDSGTNPTPKPPSGVRPRLWGPYRCARSVSREAAGWPCPRASSATQPKHVLHPRWGGTPLGPCAHPAEGRSRRTLVLPTGTDWAAC